MKASTITGAALAAAVFHLSSCESVHEPYYGSPAQYAPNAPMQSITVHGEPYYVKGGVYYRRTGNSYYRVANPYSSAVRPLGY